MGALVNTVTHNEQETIDLAIQFARSLEPMHVITLKGDLGAGKTCFVRGLCEGLGGDPTQVNSPTFTIVQEYIIANNKRLIHIDAYRLLGEDELETIGWDELLSDRDSIIAIEWPTRIANALPNEVIAITFDHVGLHTRSITIDQSSSGDKA